MDNFIVIKWILKSIPALNNKRLKKPTSHQKYIYILSIGKEICYYCLLIASIAIKLCRLETVQDFFDQVGHQTTNASIENKHFFTKHWHRQTYQNYEQYCQRCQNSEFQSHFSVSKIGQIFPKKNISEEYLIRKQTFIFEIFWKL
jgi:hypothetical protein